MNKKLKCPECGRSIPITGIDWNSFPDICPYCKTPIWTHEKSHLIISNETNLEDTT